MCNNVPLSSSMFERADQDRREHHNTLLGLVVEFDFTRLINTLHK